MDEAADVLLDPGDDLFEGQPRGVDDAGIGGGFHRGDGPRGVAGVAFLQVAPDGLDGDRLVASGEFGMAAACPFVETGGQKELAERVGEDDRPLVAALGDHVILGGERALPDNELAADAGAVGQVT